MTSRTTDARQKVQAALQARLTVETFGARTAFHSMTEHLENATDDDYVDNKPEDRADLEDRGTGGSLRGPSRMAAFGTCARRGRFHYHEGLVLRKDKPFRLGGRLVHLGVAYYHASLLRAQQQEGRSTLAAATLGTLRDTISRALQAAAPISESLLPDWFYKRDLQSALLVEAGPDAPPSSIRQANEAIARYVADHRAAESDGNLTELFIEHQFEARLGELDGNVIGTQYENEIVTCRSDRILEDTGGFVWIEDHKTKGRGRSKSGVLPAWKTQNEHYIDWQAMVNLHIVRKRLAPRIVRGFVIQRIQRVWPFDHDRNSLRIPAMAYEDVPREMSRCVALDVEAEQQYLDDEPTHASYWACWDRFGACDYAPLCAAQNKKEADAIRAADYRTVVTVANLKKAARAAASTAAICTSNSHGGIVCQ